MVADAVGALDGHIVLSRKLRMLIISRSDVLRSVSRLDRAVCSEEEMNTISWDLLSVTKMKT